jgi:hypothetical protein
MKRGLGRSSTPGCHIGRRAVFIRDPAAIFFFGRTSNAHNFERSICLFVLQSSSEKCCAMSTGWPGQKVLVQSLGSNLAAEWLLVRCFFLFVAYRVSESVLLLMSSVRLAAGR